MPSCNTYHLTWFLLPWAWGISSRPLTSHNSLWTLHCTPERGNPAPPTRTLTQASLTRDLDKPLVQPYPQGGTSTIKRIHKLSIQKGHPKHSNLNKMKRQRNIQQVKEHDKSPPNQTKEEEIENLPDIEV